MILLLFTVNSLSSIGNIRSGVSGSSHFQFENTSDGCNKRGYRCCDDYFIYTCCPIQVLPMPFEDLIQKLLALRIARRARSELKLPEELNRLGQHLGLCTTIEDVWLAGVNCV